MATCDVQVEAPRSGPVLVVGATGNIGRFVAEACLDSGLRTFILVRPGNTARPSRVDELHHKGAVIVESRLDGNDKEGRSVVGTLLRDHGIEVVISAVGGPNILDQLGLIEDIQAAGGTVKRFVPSEFGLDADRVTAVGAGQRFYEEKRRVRRAAEASGVPYTYICCNSIAGWPYLHGTHPTSDMRPPLDRFQIYSDGSVRAYFVARSDIGKFTVKAAYDGRSMDKVVHFRPACNLMSTEEMACLWESKIGRTLPRVTVSEEDLLAMVAADVIPASIVASLLHDIFINGCQTNYAIHDDDGSSRDVEISNLYPDIPFRTMDECFDDYVRGIHLELDGKKEATELA